VADEKRLQRTIEQLCDSGSFDSGCRTRRHSGRHWLAKRKGM
jgi:hypothetical protein